MLQNDRPNDFAALLNEMAWQANNSGVEVFFDFDPDDISIFGRLAFENGLHPMVLDIPGGYAVLFQESDLGRLEAMGVRLPNQGGVAQGPVRESLGSSTESQASQNIITLIPCPSHLQDGNILYRL